MDAPISCAAIFANFNEFYFDYVSIDWLQVLMEENDTNLFSLSPQRRKALADCLRNYYPEWRKLSDDEVLEKKMAIDAEEEERLDNMKA